MIELDDVEYAVRTPEENAVDMTQYINDYCASYNIKNSKGELIYIDAVKSNPLYMIIFGLSYLVTIMQKLIYNAGCAFNISRASDRQLLNLADIANVQRRPATKTIIQCMLYADLDHSCSIPIDLSATVTVGGVIITFHPAYEVLIPAGGSVNMMLITEDEGSYSIPAGSITGFDTVVDNLRNMISNASIPGVEQESITDLRSRIQRRSNQTSRLDRAANAIENLAGVLRCNIFFNYSVSDAAVIQDISVPPRRALLIVQGFSSDIAVTFYNYLLCETAEGPEERTTVQNYVVSSGQVIPVYIVSPRQTTLSIRIYIGETITDELKQGVKDSACKLAESTRIASAISSAEVIKQVSADYPLLNIQGAEVAKDGSSFMYMQSSDSDELFVYNSNAIEIVEAVE